MGKVVAGSDRLATAAGLRWNFPAAVLCDCGYRTGAYGSEFWVELAGEGPR